MKNLDGAIATLDEAAKYQSTQNPPRYLAGIYGLQGDIFLEMESPTMAGYSYRKAYDNAISAEEKNKYLKLLATLDPAQTGGGI
jgi:predicted negative regulator of RcsB-dependent stress response